MKPFRLLSLLLLPRLQFRLPCNCIYLQAGVHADIANKGNEEHPYGHGIVAYRPPAHFRTGQEQFSGKRRPNG